MKYLLTIAMVFSCVTAGASKARLTSLGQDSQGSYVIQDDRNIFLNPAYVGQLSSAVIGEWGNSTVGDTTTDAEGGLIFKAPSYSLAVQLGRQTDIAESINLASTELLTPASSLTLPQNGIDVIYGNELSGLDVGIGLHYANTKNKTTATGDDEARYIAVYGGVVSDKWAVNLMLDVVHKSEDKTADLEYDGDLQLGLGGRYNLSQKSFLHGDLQTAKFEAEAAGSDTEFEAKEVNLGYTRHLKSKKSKTQNLFFDLGLHWLDGKIKATSKTNLSELSLPITVGVESKLKSWLVGRASVQQTVLIDRQEAGTAETKNINTTVVAAGIGATHGDFTLDAVLTGSTTDGQLGTNDMFSNVSLKYNY